MKLLGPMRRHATFITSAFDAAILCCTAVIANAQTSNANAAMARSTGHVSTGPHNRDTHVVLDTVQTTATLERNVVREYDAGGLASLSGEKISIPYGSKTFVVTNIPAAGTYRGAIVYIGRDTGSAKIRTIYSRVDVPTSKALLECRE